MKLFSTIFIIILILLGIRHLRWYLVNNVERPDFEVITDYDTIQIRKIPQQLYATVTMTGNESQVSSKAFRILAGFIFGWNKSRTSVAMTSPVISQQQPQTIAMTSPVISQKANEWSYNISFLMPKEYSIDTLPIPDDDRITIHSVDERIIAVISFNAYATANRIEKYRTKLLAWLKALNIATLWEPIVAQYNDPWTPPLMRTNEIRIEINRDSIH